MAGSRTAKVVPLSAVIHFPPEKHVDRNNDWFCIFMALKNPVKTVSYELFAEITLIDARFPPCSPSSSPRSLLAACGSPAPRPPASSGTIAQPLAISEKGNEVALYALGLIDTGYRFGGKNPEAGLDCSGMVSFIYGQAAGLQRAGQRRRHRPAAAGRSSATCCVPATSSSSTRATPPFSHVGIYVGDARFVHAPSSNGRVRIDRLERPLLRPALRGRAAPSSTDVRRLGR